MRPLLAALAAASLCCGTALAADDETSPPEIHVDCRGEPTASPTVILEAGAFGTSADWDFVLDDLAKGGRACAYDRGGVGDSPPRAGGEDPISIARELAATLDGLGERGPVILVGHSNGQLYVEAFAALWPERVAGVVYINGVGVDDLDDPRLLGYLAQERRLADMAAVSGRLGLAPLAAGELIAAEGLTGEAAARKMRALTCLKCLETARDEDRAIIPGLATVRALGDVSSSIPTVVIIGVTDPDSAASRAWRAAEIAPAVRARRSWIMDAVGATHVSPLSRDRAWIVAAVDWLRSEVARTAH